MKNLLVLLACMFSAFLYSQEVITIAGGGAIGNTDGASTVATFNNPHGIATDNQGTVYVADRFGHAIRKISTNGDVTTLAGSGIPGNSDGTGTSASFNEPWSLCVGIDGNIYVADTKNNIIRKITPQGVVSTFAGNGSFGISDGPGATASFGSPSGIEMDESGNLYVADHLTHVIRKITPDGTVSRLAGSPYVSGFIDGNGNDALFNRPYGLTVEVGGNIIVADEWNHAIRSISPSGQVSTIIGNGTSGHVDGSSAYANFNYPWDVAVDNSGNIFVADGINHSIRKITPSASAPVTYGVLTFAGISTVSGWLDGYGTGARFNGPAGLHYSKESGEVFIADTYNNRIRKIIDHEEQSVLLEVEMNPQGVICEQDSCKAKAFPANFDTYIFFVDGQVAQTGPSDIFETNSLSAGNHTILCHGVNTEGSFVSNEFNINILEATIPVIEVNGALPMPEQSSVVLSTSEAISCTWSTGETTEFIEIEEPDVVTVDVLFANGCVGTSEPVNIQQFCSIETPIIEFAGSNDCTFASAILITNYDGDIQWLLNGEAITGATENTYEATEDGVYQIMATTYQQNVYSNILIVDIIPTIIDDFTSNKTLIFDNNPQVKFKSEVFNNPGSDYSYLWNFGDVDSGNNNLSTQKDPKHSFSGVGVYNVSLTVTDNATGCAETMHKPDMIICVEGLVGGGDDNNNIVYIPTAFSPNGDGENDILFVRGEEIANVEFNVFNQKGKLIFESKDQSIGWDGIIQGQPAPNETYNYIVKVRMNNGDEETRSGKVFLIR
jgi:gliding motility-associated-like protein